MGGRPQQPQVTRTQETRDPYAPAQPHINASLGAAQQAFNATPRTPYTGNFFAGANQQQMDANQLGSQIAASFNPGSQGTNVLSQYLNAGPTQAPSLTGAAPITAPTTGALPAQSGADLQAAFQAQLDPLVRNFNERIIPQAVLNQVGSGAFDNSRSAFQNAQLFQDSVSAPASEALARIVYEDFARQQSEQNANWRTAAQINPQLALQTAGMNEGARQFDQSALLSQAGLQNDILAQYLNTAAQLPQLQSQEMANALVGPSAMSAFGAEAQGWEQNMINNALAQFQEQYTAPWRGVNEYAQVANAAGGQGGTASGTTTAPPPQRSGGGLAGAFSGALGGLMSAGPLAGALGMAGPPGWLALALGAGGALAGGM